MDQLMALHKAAAGRIELLPGGGIRAHNAAPYRAAGFDWLHTAALSPEAYAAEVPLPDETEVKTLLAG
jgi:copper homeostasis protein CutC